LIQDSPDGAPENESSTCDPGLRVCAVVLQKLNGLAENTDCEYQQVISKSAVKPLPGVLL